MMGSPAVGVLSTADIC